MSSTTVFKIAELLKDCELRDEQLCLSEKACASREVAVELREKDVLARETSIRAESAMLEELRNVSAERIKTQGMLNQVKVEEEKLLEQRQNFAKEQAGESDTVRKMKIELEGALGRIGEKRKQLEDDEKKLTEEKVKHHEKVVREMQLIEKKKAEIK